MLYRLLADLILLAHLAFVLFVVIGGFLTWRWPRVRWAHIPAAAWGLLVEAAGLTCPLTPLEQWLRVRAGDVASAGDFVTRHLLPFLYPEELTRTIQIALAVFVAAVNVIAYAGFRRIRSRQHAGDLG